jgi:alkylated DNA repair dioxygenase AlkB
MHLLDRDEDPSELKSLEGFRYRAGLIEPQLEEELIVQIRGLPFQEFDFHGYKGKRRVVSFGWQYDYSGRQLRIANGIPDYLLSLRSLAGSFAGLEPGELRQALVTEYGPGAGIGWHRDKAVFGQVIAISLLSPCVLRFRRKVGESTTSAGRRLRHWERVNVLTEPRSVYLLSGPVRSTWEHSILRVDELRYSITFRTLECAGPAAL